LISVFAFTLFTSAVMAEIVRGGLNSVPDGQFEAARSQGFGFFSSTIHIILPQTFRAIIPALFSQCTTVIKDSSYLSGINVAEFMYTTNVVMAHAVELSQVLALYGFVFLLYFALNFGISLLVRAYQRRIVAA
jgi:putative glutamine transport system permease protein